MPKTNCETFKGPNDLEYLSLEEHQSIIGEQLTYGYEYTVKEIANFERQVKILKEALEFYAHDNNYTNDGIIFDQYNVGPTHEPVLEQVQDYGNKAKQALKACEKVK